MVKGFEVDIVIIDNMTGEALRLPVLPTNGRLEYDDGDQKPITVDLLDVGSVEIPAGVELDSWGWESFFPARYDESYVRTQDLKKPLEYRNRFSSWKDAGTSLQLVCPAFGINKTMYCASFKPALAGFEGDIEYSVVFRELKPIVPKKLTPGGQPIVGLTSDDRPPLPGAPSTGTYTVVAGDTLTLIGKKIGQPWRTVYENNKDSIGPNPNRILPGQVLIV